MPNQVTYGKKKKSILSLFPILTDEDSPLQLSKPKSGKRVSTTISMKAFYGKHENDYDKNSPSALDDSIEEMASMLPDDTAMNQMAAEPGKRLSNLVSAKILPLPPRQAFFRDKALPQLPPQLSFGGGDEWATRSYPVTATAEISSDGDPLCYEEEPDSCPPPVFRQPAHLRKGSAPPLPRKSSKRTSRQREGKEIAEVQSSRGDNKRQLEPRKLSKIAQQNSECQSPSKKDESLRSNSAALPDVSQQIEAMMVASRTLKPLGDNSVNESPATSKKSGMRGNGVLSKMKFALTERFQDKGLKKHHYLAKNEHLLDPNLSQLADYDEEASTISAMELRINEGINFGNRKIQSLTGHGIIRRKPIADDGKPLLSRKPVDGPSKEDVRDSGTRAMYNFDNRRKSNLSFDQSTEYLPPLPSRSHRVREEVLRILDSTNVQASFEVDFDALFSSSPVAQSTPRIRLEPTFEENGGKKLRNVPADSRSLFDTDSSMCGPSLDVGVTTTPLQNNAPRKAIVKRNNSKVKDLGLGVKAHVSKRRKKHPSPSKAKLEGFEDALKHYSPRVEFTDAKSHEHLVLSSGEFQTRDILKSKDNNAPLSQTAKRSKASRLGVFGKPKQSAAGYSMAEPARRPTGKLAKPSMIPKPAGAPTMKRRAESRMYRLENQGDGSAMDTDELQWD